MSFSFRNIYVFVVVLSLFVPSVFQLIFVLNYILFSLLCNISEFIRH